MTEPNGGAMADNDIIEIRVVCSGTGKPRHGTYEHVTVAESLDDARVAIAEWDTLIGTMTTAQIDRTTVEECLPLCVEVRNVTRWVRVHASTDSRATGGIPE